MSVYTSAFLVLVLLGYIVYWYSLRQNTNCGLFKIFKRMLYKKILKTLWCPARCVCVLFTM